MRIVPQSIEFLRMTTNPEFLCEIAGRTAHKSESQGNPERFIEKIVHTLGHESVIEHASATYNIICDRGISHEIVRHRLVSYTQESTRYCNYSKDKFSNEITVIEPPGLGAARIHWHNACIEAETSYFDLLDADCPPQIARSVLPTCLKTELVMTCNFREWRHFIKLRTDKKAHPKIQEIAGGIRDDLYSRAPVFFKDLLND